MPSQYELERQANIARNKQLLEQLQLKQAVADLGFPATKPAHASKPTARPVKPAKPEKKKQSEVPRRQSARLRTIADPDESPSKKRKREAELEKERAREAQARIEAEERERIAKRPRHHDLNLAELMDEDEAARGLSTELKTITSQSRRVGDPEAFAFDDDKRDERYVEELREKLKDLKVVSRAKVTQDRVYSAAYHPDVSKDLIFFGDKHGQLGIWDARAQPEEVADEDDVVDAEEREGGRYHRLQVHWPATSKSSISCIKLDPLNATNLYTSSYDCSIRSLSFETGVSTEIFSTGEELPCSIDLTPSGQEMWISDGVGGLTHLDLRQPRKSTWYSLAGQKIGCVSINPTRPTFLLTASNDRTLRIWDVRKLQLLNSTDDAPPTPPASSPGPEGDNSDSNQNMFDSEVVKEFLDSSRGKACMRAEWRHGKSVSSAYWDPRGRSIVSTSYDDTLRLWEVGPSRFESNTVFPSSRPFGQIAHNCQTGKWLTILRAQWSPNPSCYPHFTIGNMNHSLDIYSCKGDLIARLSDKSQITAVQAVTCSHPNIVERVCSGNASGRCVLWAPRDDL